MHETRFPHINPDSQKWRTQEQIAMRPKSSSDFDLEAHEALPGVLAHVERLLATFAPAK